jgi:hypothetical protein
MDPETALKRGIMRRDPRILALSAVDPDRARTVEAMFHARLIEAAGTDECTAAGPSAAGAYTVEGPLGAKTDSYVTDMSMGPYGMLSRSLISPLPSQFRGVASWPARTAALCWNCTLQFDTVPLFVPADCRVLANRAPGGISRGPYDSFVNDDKHLLNHEPRPGPGHEMRVRGVACSFPCAAALIPEFYADSGDRDRAVRDLKLIHIEIYGWRPVHIPPGPHRWEMDRYGGALTPAAMREKIREAAETMAS